MRVRLLLVSVAFVGSVYFFISKENELNAVTVSPILPSPSNASEPLAINSSMQPAVTMPLKVQKEVAINNTIPEQDVLLQEAKGQVLMTALTRFWQQCSQQNRCDEMLAQQQSTLDERRYQLLLNFPVNQQKEQGLMGASLTSQDATLVDKIANVKSIRNQVWGADVSLLFEDQDAYYNYRLSLVESNNMLSQAQDADEFIQEYNTMLEEQGDDLLSFGLGSDGAKYEEAVKLIPTSMPDHEVARIKADLAKQYLTPDSQQDIANRANQVELQQQDVMSYQQGLNELELTLADERATTKKTLSDEEWQVYKAERLYQYRLAFFRS